MDKGIEWVSRHGWTLLVGALSFFAGMAVMLPVGRTLDGAAAGLIGAVVGAVATIGGALLLWQVQERYRSEQLAKAIAMQFGSIFPMCDDLLGSIPGRDARQIKRDAKSLLEEINASNKKLARFDGSLHLLPSRKVGFLLNAEILVATMKANGERIEQMVNYLAGNPTLANEAINSASKSLRENYSELGKELERFAPDWSEEG